MPKSRQRDGSARDAMSAHAKTSRRAKHMRLGTKSCAECRRRKIRCIFPDETEACTACQLHATICEPQGNIARLGQIISAAKPEERLQIYERLWGQLLGAANMHIDIGSDVDSLEASTARLVDMLHSIRHQAPLAHDQEKDDSMSESILASHVTQSEQVPDGHNYASAPMISFMMQSTMVEHPRRNATTSGNVPNISDQRPASVINVRKLLPSATDIVKVLEATQNYWPLWPLHPAELSPSQSFSVPVVKIASSFIDVSMQSQDPAIVAKAIMWLCLCIQQVSTADRRVRLHGCAISTEMVSRHMEAVDVLLNFAGRDAFSRAGVITLVLQTKYLVNMGRLREAWIAIRRAVDQSLVLGLHLESSEAEQEDTRIWTTVWGYEQQLSLLLGVPRLATWNSQSLLGIQDNEHPEFRVMHQINLLCGQINDRNRNYQRSSYADTMALDEELVILHDMIPLSWSDTTGVDKLPLEAFHVRQIARLYFYHLKQLVHLPYMLKATNEKRFEYSRTSVLEAIDGITYCYQERHLHPQGSLVMCFLVDFIAFSAGLVLATDLISQPSSWTKDVEQQKWTVITRLISELKSAADTLVHPVAEQGAQLLEKLYLARHGLQPEFEEYEAVVPLFGKVLIRHSCPPHHSCGKSAKSGCSVGCNNTSTVAFGSSIFDPSPSACRGSGELDVDWTSILDDHITYGWNWGFDP